MHQKTELRVGKEFLRDYALPLTTPDNRPRLEALLNDPDFEPTVTWYQIYDAGAEIIADEVLVITPRGAKESAVVSLVYMYS